MPRTVWRATALSVKIRAGKPSSLLLEDKFVIKMICYLDLLLQ